MTALASTPIENSASLPIGSLADAHAPASVRENERGARQAYSTAQSFEELLLNQLSQSLTQNAGLTGEGEGESGEGGASESEDGTVASLLSQALTEGVMHAGGLGLAAQLMSAVDPQLGSDGGAASTSVYGAESAPAPVTPTNGAATSGMPASAVLATPTLATPTSAPASAGGGSAYSPAGSLATTGGASA